MSALRDHLPVTRIILQTTPLIGLMLSSGCYYAISPPVNQQRIIAAAKNTCRTAALRALKQANAQQWHQCIDTRLNVNFRLSETAVAEFPAIGSAIVSVEVSDPERAQHRIDCYPRTGLVMMEPSSHCYYGIQPNP